VLRLDDGGGLWTTAGLIDTIIVELNEIECKGVQNYAHVISCVNKLGSVKNAVKELEDKLDKLQNGSEDECNDTDNR